MEIQSVNENRTYNCEELWYKYEPSIRGICKYKLKKYPEDVDDIVIEVYLAFCEACKKEQEIGNIEAWLFAVLHNKITAKYKELSTYKERYESYDEEKHVIYYEMNFDEPTVPDSVIDATANEIISSLKEEEQELLELVDRKKVKYKAISKQKNKTIPSLKQAHYRAAKKAKERIKEEAKKF